MDELLAFLSDGSARARQALGAAQAFAIQAGYTIEVRREGSGITAAMLAVPQPPGGVAGRWVGDDLVRRQLRQSSIPLLVVPPVSPPHPPRRVVFGADLSPRSRASYQETITICQRLGAELAIIHVFGDGLPASERDTALRATARNPGELLRIDEGMLLAMQDAAGAAGVTSSIHTVEGRAHSEIVRFASEADLIAVATHGPRIAEDVLFGTTSERVARTASVPVLVLRA